MSKTRNEAVLNIRPHIAVLENYNQSKFELFQNKTLRPICKFQNEIIIDFILFYINDKNKTFAKHAPSDKQKYIDSLFHKDSSFKNVLKGMIIGHFSREEFEFYITNISEINKRIIQLIKTRFISQFEN